MSGCGRVGGGGGSSPDGRRLVALVQPLLGGADVHAPEAPVVAVRAVGVLLHLERVVLDVVDGREDDPPVVVLDPAQNRLGPGRKKNVEGPEMLSVFSAGVAFRVRPCDDGA